PPPASTIPQPRPPLPPVFSLPQKRGRHPPNPAKQSLPPPRRILDEADAAKNLFRKPAGKQTLTLALMRTLDVARTIALLKPLTASPDVALRLVGTSEPADARIVSRNIAKADEHFIPLWTERYVAALPPSHP